MCNTYQPPSIEDIERFFDVQASAAVPDIHPLFPRATGPFVRAGAPGGGNRELVFGQWGLVPWFAKTPKLRYSTNNARAEELTEKASYKLPWKRGQRCLIPAASFDEPNWETGKNIWHRFRRTDGTPWGLAGLWNTWTDKETGELLETYTMLTLNADHHPLMRRMHKPDPKLPPDAQDKRSVIPLEPDAFDAWLNAPADEAYALLTLPGPEAFDVQTR